MHDHGSSAERSCPCCGGREFAERAVLWPELIAAWELSPDDAAMIDRQQGRHCTRCGSSWRTMALARAILDEWKFPGLMSEFVADPRFRHLRVLEINLAGQLTQFLKQLPFHRLVEFPRFDMQHLGLASEKFDLVVHSDTLEHIPDPLAALRECHRVLRPGGICAFTVPQILGRLTRDCHNRPPSYHGNGSNPEDYRVHTEFGADAWTWPAQVGFDTVSIAVWDYPSAMALVGRKRLETPRPPERFGLTPSGERLLPSMQGSIVVEHLHRYALACDLADGKDVLDVACGEGYGSHLLADRAKSVVGIDIESAAVEHARHTYPRDNLRYLQGDCCHLPLPDASIDLAVSFETIEHITAQADFLAELRRVLRPDGVLIISTPDRPVYDRSTPDNEYHQKELTAAEFQQLLQAEFRHVQLSGQRLCNGSITWPVAHVAIPLHCLTGDFEGLASREGLGETPYLIAVATNGPELPRPRWGLFEQPGDQVWHSEQLRRSQSELAAVQSSTSWRITAPLRWLRNRLRGSA